VSDRERASFPNQIDCEKGQIRAERAEAMGKSDKLVNTCTLKFCLNTIYICSSFCIETIDHIEATAALTEEQRELNQKTWRGRQDPPGLWYWLKLPPTTNPELLGWLPVGSPSN
jgi:hypothetical protein